MSSPSPSRPASGSKIVSPHQGTLAVLDGIKPNALSTVPDAGPKPPWLRVRLPNGAKYREVMGATNPEQAAEGTIRKQFAMSIGENSVHGSDSLENAKIEIEQFFTDADIVG